MNYFEKEKRLQDSYRRMGRHNRNLRRLRRMTEKERQEHSDIEARSPGRGRGRGRPANPDSLWDELRPAYKNGREIEDLLDLLQYQLKDFMKVEDVSLDSRDRKLFKGMIKYLEEMRKEFRGSVMSVMSAYRKK